MFNIPENDIESTREPRQSEMIRRFHSLAKRETEWFKGRTAKSGEPGYCATFDGPIRAVRCAWAIRNSARELQIEIKTGLHTGLCEMTGEQVEGEAVEISKRVAARAAAGEVLVSNTVKDLVSGSGITFGDKGTLNAEDIPGAWQLFVAS